MEGHRRLLYSVHSFNYNSDKIKRVNSRQVIVSVSLYPQEI